MSTIHPFKQQPTKQPFSNITNQANNFPSSAQNNLLTPCKNEEILVSSQKKTNKRNP